MGHATLRTAMLIDKSRFPVREILLHGWLPSPLKKLFYRLRGYRIGRGVSLAFGSVIIGGDVSIGDEARIGFLTFIRGETIRLGRHVQIGATTMLDTPHLELGDGTKINEQVFVGGLQYPDSKLVVGRNCQIMQMTFINPCRSIVIGDDTGIGGDCLLFGHTSWLSQFEGYPVDFDSIVIGNSVSIAWRVFILPGTRISDGAVVGANSLVRGQIPGRCLAVGFPARVVSRAPEFPRPVPPEEKAKMLENVIVELMSFLTTRGYQCQRDGPGFTVRGKARRGWWRRTRSWRLRMYVQPLEGADSGIGDADVLVSLCRIPAALRAALTSRGVMWLDLEAKERSDQGNELGEEAAQHLRRYGVRFIRAAASAT
jgi:acetyltransferase-like isoleucine patch superfamily enzyme